MPASDRINQLEACAAIGKANGGNVRLALEMLWKAANLAERKNAKKIELEDVKEASEKTFYKKIAEASPVSERRRRREQAECHRLLHRPAQ
jgi:Cdc6-like AAA superfamily ATPase